MRCRPARSSRRPACIFARRRRVRFDGKPWTPHTLALARSLNRPIMIDIGAVWCHWCHVMDATTYADPQVAAALNSEFVPVKVDTDERPDLDEYYQNAAAQLTGAGGWPLTCFTTPDGALFFAAGYLPPRPGSGPNGSGGENSSMLPLLEANLAGVRDGSRGTRKRGRGDRGEAQIRVESERADTGRTRRAARADTRRAGNVVRSRVRRIRIGTGAAILRFSCARTRSRARLLRASGVHRDGARHAEENRGGWSVRSTWRRISSLLDGPALARAAFREARLRQRDGVARVQRRVRSQRRSGLRASREIDRAAT